MLLGQFQPTAFLFKQQPRMGLLQSADEFQEILARERIRADRSGIGFSLLTWRILDTARLTEKIGLLDSTFAARLRVTDTAGMLGKDTVGVVLPYTPASGAWKVADDLRDLIPSSVGQISCEVYEYPSGGPAQDGELAATKTLGADSLVADPRCTLFSRATWWKHVLDISGAVVGLIIAAPIMLAAAFAIKLTSPGPILFCQLREGRFGKPFRIYKFRTMRVGADSQQAELRACNEQDGPAFKMSRDPRVTPVGRLLRVTSIDELPQFWNVLRREMSLVGPRPLPLEESASCDGWQRRRLEVQPGMTCFWQVHGRSQVSFDEWIRMDLQYIRSRSFVTDLKILFQTIPAVLGGRGAK